MFPTFPISAPASLLVQLRVVIKSAKAVGQNWRKQAGEEEREEETI